eukprot:g9789.t1
MLVAIATLALHIISAGAVHYEKIFIMVFENHGYEQTNANSYWAEILAKSYQLTNYYSVIHKSQPNYVALLGGTYDACINDNECSLELDSLVDRLEDAGLSWRGYMEDYQPKSNGDCNGMETNGYYYRKHNPFMSFSNIKNDYDRCLKIGNQSSFYRDVLKNDLPNFGFYAPNADNDSHNQNLDYSGKYLQNWLNTWFYGHPEAWANTLLFITFDEDDNHANEDNHIPAFFPIGTNYVKQAGHDQGTPYTHYSFTCWVEENWNLGSLYTYDQKGSSLSLPMVQSTGHAGVSSNQKTSGGGETHVSAGLVVLASTGIVIATCLAMSCVRAIYLRALEIRGPGKSSLLEEIREDKDHHYKLLHNKNSRKHSIGQGPLESLLVAEQQADGVDTSQPFPEGAVESEVALPRSPSAMSRRSTNGSIQVGCSRLEAPAAALTRMQWLSILCCGSPDPEESINDYAGRQALSQHTHSKAKGGQPPQKELLRLMDLVAQLSSEVLLLQTQMGQQQDRYAKVTEDMAKKFAKVHEDMSAMREKHKEEAGALRAQLSFLEQNAAEQQNKHAISADYINKQDAAMQQMRDGLEQKYRARVVEMQNLTRELMEYIKGEVEAERHARDADCRKLVCHVDSTVSSEQQRVQSQLQGQRRQLEQLERQYAVMQAGLARLQDRATATRPKTPPRPTRPRTLSTPPAPALSKAIEVRVTNSTPPPPLSTPPPLPVNFPGLARNTRSVSCLTPLEAPSDSPAAAAEADSHQGQASHGQLPEATANNSAQPDQATGEGREAAAKATTAVAGLQQQQQLPVLEPAATATRPAQETMQEPAAPEPAPKQRMQEQEQAQQSAEVQREKQQTQERQQEPRQEHKQEEREQVQEQSHKRAKRRHEDMVEEEGEEPPCEQQQPQEQQQQGGKALTVQAGPASQQQRKGPSQHEQAANKIMEEIAHQHEQQIARQRSERLAQQLEAASLYEKLGLTGFSLF